MSRYQSTSWRQCQDQERTRSELRLRARNPTLAFAASAAEVSGRDTSISRFCLGPAFMPRTGGDKDNAFARPARVPEQPENRGKDRCSGERYGKKGGRISVLSRF